MENLKLVVAGNLIRLRTEAGLTQAELGAMLNYSDKTVSKWERADALPDAAVLKQLGEIYGVSVDYLLNDHDQWQPEGKAEAETENYSRAMIIWVSVIGIWTFALLLFVIFWVLGSKFWLIFVAAIPVSLITFLVLNSVLNKGRKNKIIICLLVLSIFILVYAALYKFNPWQLFLVAIPAELLVFLSFGIRKRSVKKNLQKIDE